MKLYYRYINIRLFINSISYFLKVIIFIKITSYIIINYIKIISRFYKNLVRYIYRKIKFRN